MRDVIEESNPLNRLFEHLYNRFLGNHQDWMKYYASLIEWVKPNESAIGYRLCSSYAKKLITKINPSVIVSVHPMVNHFLARTLKDLGLSGKIKLITVLTDPNADLWTGWACPGADLTIAPNDLARDKLISLGLEASKIKVIGMPILPEFLKIPLVSRQVLLTQLGLDPAVVTITISAGSAGGGNMLRIYQALEGIKKKVQIIFVCGKNPKLQLAMDKEIERSSLPTVVLSYADSVADGMNACDLLVTKPGGLTTFEAIARRLPMAFDMVTALMPQESGTADMVIEAQLAKPIRRPEDIVSIVESITIVKDRLNKTLPTEHNLNRVDAVYDIAKTILSYCKSPAELAQTPTMPEQPSV